MIFKWSSWHLYTLETVLERDGKSVDRIVQQYGVRIISMDAKRGLLINGERTIIRGGCLHHDNGLLDKGPTLLQILERTITPMPNRGPPE